MSTFNVPTKDQVSENNQAIFGQLEKGLGFVPNIYATMAHSENALQSYLTLQNAKNSLKAKEKEVVNLVVSQYNECVYCLAAHTALGKMNGFTDEQILDIRGIEITFDNKLKALAELSHEIVAKKGHVTEEIADAFYTAGYTKENYIDVLVLVGDKIISNYLHAATQIPVDFPAAPALEKAVA